MPAIGPLQLDDASLRGQSLRYLLATVLSAVLSFCIPWLLHEGFGLREELAVAIALVTVLCVNFLTVRIFVFRSAAPPAGQFVRFAASSVAFRLAEYGLFLGAFRLLGLHYLLALLLALGVSFVAKFWFQRRYVFQD